MKKEKRVIVFGGSGFVGGHVADALTDAGYEVVIFDKRQFAYLRPEQKMVIGNILDEKLVAEEVKESDIVYNFAGIADVEEAAQEPLDSIKNNILGNSIILEACRKAGTERYIFASTLYVYSKAGSFYRSTKQACELLIEDYHEVYNLPYTILRYGSLYGPRADKRNSIHNILTQALTEGKIVRHGNGEEVREYIHVFDAAKNSIEILLDEFVNQCVMITGTEQRKVKDLLFMIKEMLNNRIEIEFTAPKYNYHYEMTPYNFAPKLAKRFVSRTHLDLGQGILRCIHDIYKELNSSSTDKKFVVVGGEK